MLDFVLTWLRGWRVDHDDWIVRARRADDPDLKNRSEVGFTEEACIAVRTRQLARMVDRGHID